MLPFDFVTGALLKVVFWINSDDWYITEDVVLKKEIISVVKFLNHSFYFINQETKNKVNLGKYKHNMTIESKGKKQGLIFLFSGMHFFYNP